MTDTTLHPRKSAGTAGAGQWTERSFKEGTPKLTGRRTAPASSNREVPESLRMAHFQDPKLTHELEWEIERSVGVSDAEVDYRCEAFSDLVPNLHYEEAYGYFNRAQLAFHSREDWKAVVAEAAAADTERHPGGTIKGDYVPPILTHQQGYGQGVLTTGSKHTGAFRDATSIAKDIRTELKTATEANYLPAGLKYSVTNRKFAGGQAIDVAVQGVSDADRVHGSTGLDRFGQIAALPEFKQLEARVEAITNAYNKTDIDSQSDYFNVSYYSHVNIETDRDLAFREREAASRKAARAK
jgi:hypothetical protein